ncbi:MAG: hypothetical protein QOJ71_2084 [Actinomycetota bacterium]|nr:hypothetical protein [Actinomycetota bacterium]
MLVRSVIGALLALLALAPVVMGARSLRRRFMPELVDPVATLADIVLVLSIVVGVSELLGTVGAFELVPVTLALAGAGVLALRAGRVASGADDPDDAGMHDDSRRSNRGARSADAAPPGTPVVARAANTARWWPWATVFTIAVVSGEWMSRVVDSWHRGMSTTDTLWYHLPIAARFVQEGWTSRLHFVDARSLIVFYPATSELLHAVGMLFLGNDVLSLVINLGWLALALFSAYCIGFRFGVAPLTLIGAAIVLATPQLVLDDAGSGLNDIVGVALFLAAIALTSHAVREGISKRERHTEMLCGALAAGLGVGTKYTLVLPVAVLAVGVLALTPRGERIRFIARWFGVVVLAGGYWYVRNVIETGSPIPTAKIGLGPVQLPSIPFPGTSTVAHYLLHADAWTSYFFPGMNGAFGPVWWGLSAAAAAGIIIGAVASDERTVRVLSFIGLGCLLAFIFTPQIIGGANPIYFKPNARYVAPALVLGTVVLPIVLRRRPRLLSALLGAYLVVLVGTQFASTVWRNAGSGYAPITQGSMPHVIGICFGVLVAAIGLLCIAPQRPNLRRPERPAAFVLSLAAAVVGFGAAGLGAEQYALNHRYRHVFPMVTIYRWAQGVHDSRIATVNFSVHYPLYGKDLSNYVQYLAVRHSNGDSTPITDCRSWRRAINDGRYRYVVAASPGFPFRANRPALEADWTRSDPAAHLVLTDEFVGAHAWLFEIRGRLDPNTCAPGPKT